MDLLTLWQVFTAPAGLAGDAALAAGVPALAVLAGFAAYMACGITALLSPVIVALACVSCALDKGR